MNTSSDQVELLVRASLTGLQVDWDQVLAEITSGWIDEEALPVGCFEGDGRESTSGSVVALVCFGGRGRLKSYSSA